MTQRRVLLVTELTTSSMAAMAREVGLPRTEAERELQTAAATFALAREVPTTDVRIMLEAVRGHVEGSSWPRPTILRRAGARRRRSHTFIGVAATAAALVITGTLVTDADGVRPTLAGERVDADEPSGPAKPKVLDLPEDSLLSADSVTRLSPPEPVDGGEHGRQLRWRRPGGGLPAEPVRRAAQPTGLRTGPGVRPAADQREGGSADRGAERRGVAQRAGRRAWLRHDGRLVRVLHRRPRAAGRDL